MDARVSSTTLAITAWLEAGGTCDTVERPILMASVRCIPEEESACGCLLP
jgi:hypothetical protein